LLAVQKGNLIEVLSIPDFKLKHLLKPYIGGTNSIGFHKDSKFWQGIKMKGMYLLACGSGVQNTFD
jgi:hypothetical protein